MLELNAKKLRAELTTAQIRLRLVDPEFNFFRGQCRGLCVTLLRNKILHERLPQRLRPVAEGSGGANFKNFANFF